MTPACFSPQRPLKVAIITTDNREAFKQYEKADPYFGTPVEALFQGMEQLADIQVDVLSNVQRPVRSPERLASNIRYHSLRVPKMGWLRIGYLGCIFAVRKKLREIKPDIVHGQGTERDCALSAAFSGFPNVVTIHGNMKAIAEIYHSSIGNYYWLAARLETLALRRTNGVFCNSAYTENLVAARTSRVWRIANALRPDFFAPVPPRKMPGVTRLLNVGVVEPRKQQVELLSMARKLHERGFKLELQFAGFLPPGSAYVNLFTQELSRAQQAGYARHIGNLSTSQLIAAMDQAAALVHFPREEAFGLVVAEALARNLKLFGATAGGVVDIATGVTGAELFAPQDLTQLEAAIAQWLIDGCPAPPPAAPLMCQRYHPQVIARRHWEIYRDTLSSTANLKR